MPIRKERTELEADSPRRVRDWMSCICQFGALMVGLERELREVEAAGGVRCCVATRRSMLAVRSRSSPVLVLDFMLGVDAAEDCTWSRFRPSRRLVRLKRPSFRLAGRLAGT